MRAMNRFLVRVRAWKNGWPVRVRFMHTWGGVWGMHANVPVRVRFRVRVRVRVR